MSAASPFILGIIQMLKRSSSAPFKCPEPPGRYYTHNLDLKNFPLPPGRMINLPNLVKLEVTFTRDRVNDEQPNSFNGKMLIAKFTGVISFNR